MVVEVMTEDLNSGEVDQDELVEWADEYGLTMPVVSDPGSAYMWAIHGGNSIGLPYMVLLDRGAVIDTKEYATVQDAADLAAN